MKADPGFYQYWPYQNRPKIRWPGGKKLAFWLAPNIEFYELNPPDNPHRKAWPQPYPAIQGYGIRDYGNRVGHLRQMALLDKYGIRGSISLSTALCDHHPEIIAMCKERNWEFFSHGIYNTRYTYGLSGPIHYGLWGALMILFIYPYGKRIRAVAPKAHTLAEVMYARHGRSSQLMLASSNIVVPSANNTSPSHR